MAEQFSWDLDAAIETLRSDQCEDADDVDDDFDPDEDLVEVLASMDGLAPRAAKRMEPRFDSLANVADESDEELVEGAGPKTRVLI